MADDKKDDKTDQTTDTTTQTATSDSVDWKKKHDDLGFKLRNAEKENASKDLEIKDLKEKNSQASQKEVELARTKLAYESGIPQRLFGLITDNTEEKIKAQIELIKTELASGIDVKSEITIATTVDASKKVPENPPPAGKVGTQNDALNKLLSANPNERRKLLEDAAKNKTKLF